MSVDQTYDRDTTSIINEYLFAFDMHEKMSDVHRDILSYRFVYDVVTNHLALSLKDLNIHDKKRFLKWNTTRSVFDLWGTKPFVFKVTCHSEDDELYRECKHWSHNNVPKLWDDYRISMFSD